MVVNVVILSVTLYVVTMGSVYGYVRSDDKESRTRDTRRIHAQWFLFGLAPSAHCFLFSSGCPWRAGRTAGSTSIAAKRTSVMSWQLAEKRRTKRFAVDWRWHWQTDSCQTANEARPLAAGVQRGSTMSAPLATPQHPTGHFLGFSSPPRTEPPSAT